MAVLFPPGRGTNQPQQWDLCQHLLPLLLLAPLLRLLHMHLPLYMLTTSLLDCDCMASHEVPTLLLAMS